MNKEARAAGRRLLPIYEQIDDHARAAALAAKASCRRGCHSCCYNLAATSIVEAVLIAHHLLTSAAWQPRLKELRAELTTQADLVDTLGGVGIATATLWLERKIPCVFLRKNGDCGIYAIRPFVCRTYYVVTPPEDCSPERNGAEVGVIDFRDASLTFWGKQMSESADAVPPAIDSLQRSVLIAMELLERKKGEFSEWLKKNNVHLQLFDVETLSLL